MPLPAGSAAAAAATGCPATGAAATAATGAAGAAGAGGVNPAGGSPSKATCRWSWWAPSVKKPGAPIENGVPTSVGRRSPVSAAISVASSRAAVLPELTISPSTRAMSIPRPSKWLETEPPEVNWSWPVLITDSSILCFSARLSSTREHPRVDRSLADVLLRVRVEDQVLVLQQRLTERIRTPPRPYRRRLRLARRRRRRRGWAAAATRPGAGAAAGACGWLCSSCWASSSCSW